MVRCEIPCAAASRLKLSSQLSKLPEPQGAADPLADNATRRQMTEDRRRRTDIAVMRALSPFSFHASAIYRPFPVIRRLSSVSP